GHSQLADDADLLDVVPRDAQDPGGVLVRLQIAVEGRRHHQAAAGVVRFGERVECFAKVASLIGLGLLLSAVDQALELPLPLRGIRVDDRRDLHREILAGSQAYRRAPKLPPHERVGVRDAAGPGGGAYPALLLARDGIRDLVATPPIEGRLGPRWWRL